MFEKTCDNCGGKFPRWFGGIHRDYDRKWFCCKACEEGRNKDEVVKRSSRPTK